MDALPTADLTATATLILAGITLALAIATVALVIVTRRGTAQARADARAERTVLERQLRSGYRPLLVDVVDPGPAIETTFPDHGPAVFDPRTVYVALEAGKIYLSVPLRNVGRGLAIVDGGGVELRGPLVGELEYRTIQRDHVPVGETTRVDLVAGYLSQQASDVAWELVVPYCDFAGEQRTLARLQVVCQGDDVGGPWLVERVQQGSPAPPALPVEQELPAEEQLPVEQALPAERPSPPEQKGVRGERVTDLWGSPRQPKRGKR
jgi:hypothetical protein